MLSQTPAMGWNSWNTFANDISDSLIRETADVLEKSGLREAGYNYVVIDDCWSEKSRNAEDKLSADPKKFPNGMKALADYIHSKNMKFGMYSCAGTRTCADFPGSFEHEFLDAETFASWNVDYLKYDYCYKPKQIAGDLLYKRMAMALRNCGRDILFSACNWGTDNPENYVRNAGVHMWRSTGDIFDNWESIKGIVYKQIDLMPYGGPGCFNDMDMLVVGMNGKGNVGLGGCTNIEYKTHFSIWCMFASPLMIGCDIRNMTDETKEILLNRELIAIDQDIEGRQPFIVINENDQIAAIRPLASGDYAIGVFNMADKKNTVYLNFWDMGLPVNCGYSLSLRNLWEHKDIGVFREGINVPLEAHESAVFRAKFVKK